MNPSVQTLLLLHRLSGSVQPLAGHEQPGQAANSFDSNLAVDLLNLSISTVRAGTCQDSDSCKPSGFCCRILTHSLEIRRRPTVMYANNFALQLSKWRIIWNVTYWYLLALGQSSVTRTDPWLIRKQFDTLYSVIQCHWFHVRQHTDKSSTSIKYAVLIAQELDTLSQHLELIAPLAKIQALPTPRCHTLQTLCAKKSTSLPIKLSGLPDCARTWHYATSLMNSRHVMQELDPLLCAR